MIPMWWSLGKETVLTKAVNNIDAVTVNLAHAYDDTQDKYIKTIMKLDSSKTILLELEWPIIRNKAVDDVSYKVWDKLLLDFSDYFEKEEWKIFINYVYTDDIPVDTKIGFADSAMMIQVKSKDNLWQLTVECIIAGEILSNKRVIFYEYTPKIDFVNSRDSRDLLWWIGNNVNTVMASYVKTAEDMISLRRFLDDNGGKHVKIFAKCQTEEFLLNYAQISKNSDGVIIKPSKLKELTNDHDESYKRIVEDFNYHGKPIVVAVDKSELDAQEDIQAYLEWYVYAGAGCILLGQDILSLEDPTDYIIEIYQYISAIHWIPKQEINFKEAKIDDEYKINDYITYSGYRAITELGIRAVICYTENGYTAAKLSSYRPDIPVVAFTKNDATYRYINLLRAIRGYRISPSFDYHSIKQTGKEIIRMIFKWSITLEDRILVVHASNLDVGENIINGLEIYKFKDI